MPDLTDFGGWIKRIIYRLDRLEGGAQLENSSITDGMMTFIRGTLRGLSGAVLEWVGAFNLTGTLTAIGSAIFRGPVSITGEDGTLDVEADAHFGGDVSITQKLDVDADAEFKGNTKIGQNLEVTAATLLKGIVTLLNNLLVSTGGTITVQDGKIVVLGDVDMTIENGGIDFDNGGHIGGDGDSVTITGGGGAKFIITPDFVTLLASLSAFITVSDDGNEVHGDTEFRDDLILALGSRLMAQGLTPLPGGATPVPLVMDAATLRVHTA